MAGFSSMDNLINAITVNGQSTKTVWNKNFNPTTAATIGDWNCLAIGGGNPASATIYNTGANLAWQPLYDSTTTAGGMLHGGNVGPMTKVILNASAYSAAASSVPGILMLVDMVGFYRVTTTTTTGNQATANAITSVAYTAACNQNDILTHAFYTLQPYTRIQMTTTGTLPTGLSTSTNYYVIELTTATCKLANSYANALAGTAISITTGTGSGVHSINTILPRYTNGVGLQALAWANNATPLGAATPNLTLTYTNPAQTGSRTTPAVLPVCRSAAYNSQILYCGVAAGKYGPFVPLQAPDTGYSSIDGIGISASYLSGEFSVGLCKPLISMPLTTIGVACERDFLNQLPSLPIVNDGACLTWLYYSTLATPTTTPFFGHVDFAWN